MNISTQASPVGEATDPGIRYGHMNQDTSLIHVLDFPQKNQKIYILGIFDGHAKCGEHAAQEAKKSVQEFLASQFLDETNQKQLSENWSQSVQTLLVNAFQKAHQDIINMYPKLRKVRDSHGETWYLFDDGTTEKQSLYKKSKYSTQWTLQVILPFFLFF